MKPVKQPVSSSFIKLWWFPLFVAAVVVVGTPLVVVPKVKQILEADRDLKRVEVDLEKAEKKISQVKSVDESQINQLNTSFLQALPSQNPYYPVLLLLEQLSADTGVALGDFKLNPGSLASDSAKVEKVVSKEMYETMNTKLDIQGSSEQVADFVVKLHESVPLLMVSSISINQGSEDDIQSAQLDLQVLYKSNSVANETKGAVSLEPLPPLSGNVDEVFSALAAYFNPESETQLMIEPIPGYLKPDIFNY